MFFRVLCWCCASYDSVLFLSVTVDNLLDKLQSLSLIKKNRDLYSQTFITSVLLNNEIICLQLLSRIEIDCKQP